MNKKSCGTCSYFEFVDPYTNYGTCSWWVTENPNQQIPTPLAHIITPKLIPTYSTWGEICPCWNEKNE